MIFPVKVETYGTLKNFMKCSKHENFLECPKVQEFIMNETTPIEREFINEIISAIRNDTEYVELNYEVICSVVGRYSNILEYKESNRELFAKMMIGLDDSESI